jgi:putative membrane protein (TIGR04086 family)
MENVQPKFTSNIIDIIRALIIALVTTVVLTVVFAFIARQVELTEHYLRIGNVVISLASVIAACIFGLKTPKMGAIKGFFVGILFVLITAFLFSFLYSGTGFGLSPYDIIFGSVAGIISGILSVNLRK